MDKKTDDFMKKFLNLACALSPENLTCDGELSSSQINARHHEIKCSWDLLENSFGRKVSEDEVWSYLENKNKQRKNT